MQVQVEVRRGPIILSTKVIEVVTRKEEIDKRKSDKRAAVEMMFEEDYSPSQGSCRRRVRRRKSR